MRMYYSDYFETEPAKLELEEENGACDIEIISEWLLAAIPKTRVDAYPMYMLLKEVFRRFLKKESRIISKQIDELQKQLELTKISLSRKEEEGEVLREQLVKSESEVERLTMISNEYQNLKASFEQSESLRKLRESELKELQEKMIKEQQILIQRAEDKQRELNASHVAELKAQAHRYDQQMHDLLANAQSSNKRLLEVELQNKDLSRELESLRQQLNHALSSSPSTVVENDPVPSLPNPDGIKAFLTDAEIVDEVYMVFTDLSRTKQQSVKPGRTLNHVKELDWQVNAEQGSDKIESDLWSCLGHMLGNHMKIAPGTSFAHFLQELVFLLENHVAKVKDMETKVAEYEARASELREEISRLKAREEELLQNARVEVEPAAPKLARAGSIKDEMLKKQPSLQETATNVRRASYRIDNKIFKGKKISPARFDQVIQLAAAIYEGKALADAVDDRENNQRQSMPEYIREFLINKFGLRSIALANLQSLILGVEKFAEGEAANLRVRTFGLVSGILFHPFWHEDLSDFIVGALSFLLNLNSIKESLDNVRNQNPCIDPTSAIQATIKSWLKYGFGQFPEKLEVELQECVKKNDGDLPMHEWMAKMTEVWLAKSEEHDKYLRSKFIEHDTNGDNVLDLGEFEMLVRDVGGDGVEVERFHISKLFMQALQENSRLKGTDDSEDAMCPEAFVKVARRARLGLKT